MGLLAQQAGKYEESIRWIGQALALNPDDPDTLNSLAEAYIGQGQIQPASHCFQRLAELLPQSAEAHHRLGKTQERLGDWEAARRPIGAPWPFSRIHLTFTAASPGCNTSRGLRRSGGVLPARPGPGSNRHEITPRWEMLSPTWGTMARRWRLTGTPLPSSRIPPMRSLVWDTFSSGKGISLPPWTPTGMP